MALFDQRGQQVNKQYNAQIMNFGNVHNSNDLIVELEKVQEEFDKAENAGVLDEDTATDAKYQVTKAIQQARKQNPDKKSLLDHLNAAKTLIQGITAASGLVTSLVSAIAAVQKLF